MTSAEFTAVPVYRSHPPGPDSEGRAIYAGFVSLIGHARKSIYIHSPYFIPDETIFTSLLMAVRSGIDVRIVIPCKTDHPFVYWASYSYLGDLIRAGAKGYTYDNGFIHSKTAIIDGVVSAIGTANWDIRSFKLDFETDAFVYDEAFGQEEWTPSCEPRWKRSVRSLPWICTTTGPNGSSSKKESAGWYHHFSKSPFFPGKTATSLVTQFCENRVDLRSKGFIGYVSLCRIKNTSVCSIYLYTQTSPPQPFAEKSGVRPASPLMNRFFPRKMPGPYHIFPKISCEITSVSKKSAIHSRIRVLQLFSGDENIISVYFR